MCSLDQFIGELVAWRAGLNSDLIWMAVWCLRWIDDGNGEPA